jgi:hypothetical protein
MQLLVDVIILKEKHKNDENSHIGTNIYFEQY